MIVLDLALGSPMSCAINEINQVFRAVQGVIYSSAFLYGINLFFQTVVITSTNLTEES